MQQHHQLVESLWLEKSILGVRNVIDYVEIMTTGNAIDFGDCTDAAMWVSCNNSTTRSIRMGGEAITPSMVVD